MDVAEKLLDEFPPWVKLQKEGAAKLKELATEMEERKKNVNVTKVIGSSASVGGAAALTAAGVLTFFTGGLAAPLLLVGGAVATGAGLATNVGADIVDAVASSGTMKEAEEVSQKIQEAEQKIQRLVMTLTDEKQGDDQLPAENYVMEQILRAMAKRKGLILPDNVSLCKVLSRSPKCQFSEDDVFSKIFPSILRVVSTFVLKTAAKQTGKAAAFVATNIGGKAAGKSAVSVLTNIGGKAAAKAAGRVAGGAVGLAISIPELVMNCKDLDNCETEASQSLRKNAGAIKKASEELETQLDETEKLIERLAKVKLAIETTRRSPAQEKDLLEFAIEICEDETIRQWLRANSAAFFHLTSMFNLVKEHIDKNKKKKKRKVDIIFVAHGAIEDKKHPAVFLLPLPTITDVLLYSPLNCAIDAKAAYGIATGLIQPQHRVFLCKNKKQCRIPDEGHRPRKLPHDWNSMKRAGVQLIPKIIVQSLRQPKDGAWEAYIDLTERYGQPDTSRIVIPFLTLGVTITVPFYVVTLALSLALFFSGYEATVHLAACLDDISKVKFDREFLEYQYSYTIDNSVMTTSGDMFPVQYPGLYRALQALFDNILV